MEVDRFLDLMVQTTSKLRSRQIHLGIQKLSSTFGTKV